MVLKIKNINWKLFFLLWFMVAASIVCVLPYTLTIQSEQIKLLNVPVTMGQIIAMQLLTNGLLFGLVIGIGLLIANKIGLGLPFLDAITRGEKITKPFKPIAWFSILIGIVFGFIIIGLDTWIFNLKKVGLVLPETVHPPAWQGFLASFYGGITEEVLLRLFLLSLLVWIGNLMTKNKDLHPNIRILWIANIIAAVIFGLGHLPATKGMGLPLNSFVITRAIVLNGVAGLAFGWLYWTRGLESSMIAHFSADIVLHVLFAF
jgi:membrane protease YdiL (CAAX protease family)